MLGCVHGILLGQSVQKGVPGQAVGTVQEYQCRPTAGDVDFGVDLIFPHTDGLFLDCNHLFFPLGLPLQGGN